MSSPCCRVRKEGRAKEKEQEKERGYSEVNMPIRHYFFRVDVTSVQERKVKSSSSLSPDGKKNFCCA